MKRVCEDRLWQNSWVVVPGKKLQVESFQQILQNKPVCCEETFSQTFLDNHVGQISVPTFFGSFWKSWRESPCSWRCFVVPRTGNKNYYLTRSKLHRVWISTGSELLFLFKTDVLDLETELCQESFLRNLQYQDKQKTAQRRRKSGRRRGSGRGAGGSSSSR